MSTGFRAGPDVFLVGQPRIAKMHMQIHKTGRYPAARSIDDPRFILDDVVSCSDHLPGLPLLRCRQLQVISDVSDIPVFDQDISHPVCSGFRIQKSSVFNEYLNPFTSLLYSLLCAQLPRRSGQGLCASHSRSFTALSLAEWAFRPFSAVQPHLIADKSAIRCFCTPERLELLPHIGGTGVGLFVSHAVFTSYRSDIRSGL